jgi:hypothetical protein
MRSIAIVTPDPEAGEVLSLAFELDGWQAAVSSSRGAAGAKADLVLFDMGEGADESELRSLAGAHMAKGRLILILPRGCLSAKMASQAAGATCIPRPYELTHLVRMAAERVPAGGEPPVKPAKRAAPARRKKEAAPARKKAAKAKMPKKKKR